MSAINEGPLLERRGFVRALLVDRGALMVVSGLGSATYDVAAAGDARSEGPELALGFGEVAGVRYGCHAEAPFSHAPTNTRKALQLQ